MKKILALTITLISQVEAGAPLYTVNDLRKIEAASAITKTVTTIIKGAAVSMRPEAGLKLNHFREAEFIASW